MKSILERISEKSSFKEIQLFLKQSDCCSRSPRHDYDKFLPIFSHLTSLKRINFQTEFSGKLSSSQLHTLQKISLELKIVVATTTVGVYDVLVERAQVEDFRDLVDLFYMKQNEKQKQYNADKSSVPEENLEAEEIKSGKRKYTKRIKSGAPDVSNTINLGKTQLYKLFDIVYYFDTESFSIYRMRITGLNYVSVADNNDNPKSMDKRIVLCLESIPNKTDNQCTKLVPNVKATEVRLTEEEIKEYILSKIKVIK